MNHRVISYGVVANVIYCDIVVSEFELVSRYHAHFRTNTLRKSIIAFIPPPTAMG